MSQSYSVSMEEYPSLNNVIWCSCNTPAQGLFRGAKVDSETGRTVPVNQWLCEQCKNNWREMDDAKIKMVKRQRLSPDQWDEFSRWYDETGQYL